MLQQILFFKFLHLSHQSVYVIQEPTFQRYVNEKNEGDRDTKRNDEPKCFFQRDP